MRSFLLALLGVVLLPMAGCDSGGSGDDLDLSSFTLAVGDDDDVTHSPALFGTATNDEGQEGFGLLLGASDADFDNAQPFVAFAGVETELPGTGTYSLFDGTDDANAELPEGEVVAVYFVPPATEDGDLFVYISESGSLRVTDSDEDEMSGSYTI
ncbi:MAG TPA: hypothetical protein VK610_08715, partial [Rhodothermales bacterium]|nr:hypothetical protein [Rhodothermales bacterium]